MDIYDIIVKKAWVETMSNAKDSKWETVKYSKSEINRAGKIIVDPLSSDDAKKEALNILNNWRASHAYPLQVIASNLRLRNSNAIVVQRLKRLESITGKLERFPDMNLYRMQDLGGCRIIVDTIDDVYNVLNKYKKSRIRHILKKENDYIENPKDSGYRSYHMVYQFQSDKKETYNKNMLIEIQFRTKLQHTWATAVEMMGIYTKSALKASMGDQEILRFFKLVSSVFAKMEHTPTVKDTPSNYNDLVKEIKELDSKHKIVSRLSAMKLAINHADTKGKGGYYILILNYGKNTLRIESFKTRDIEVATSVYNRIEGTRGKNIDTVLVSANSFDSLRVAYPNYFADINEFISMMNRILF